MNKKINLNKKGIRVLGIAESFTMKNSKSILTGVVMRRDLVVDGVIYRNITIGGDDATEAIVSIFTDLNRNDINCIMIDGLIISMYNIINGEEIYNMTGIPIIGITFHDSISDIIKTIKNNFSNNYFNKVEEYQKLGKREIVNLKTGKCLFIRKWGINIEDTVRVIDAFLLQGAIPEPIKLAKIISKAYLKFVR